MNYQITGQKLLIPIDRAGIADISVNDTLTIDGFPGVKHVWTNQDAQFFESNPDDDIFLEVEKDGDRFKACGVVLREMSQQKQH